MFVWVIGRSHLENPVNLLTPADRAMALIRPNVTEEDLDRYENLVEFRMEAHEVANEEEVKELHELAVKLGFTHRVSSGRI